MMLLFRGHAVLYRQPSPGQPPNSNADEQKFWKYGMAAAQVARDLAQFQSPKLAAVAMGQAAKMTVIVKGGLPPRDTRALPAIAPPATESGVAGPDDAGGRDMPWAKA
jgi:hypothetical protein